MTDAEWIERTTARLQRAFYRTFTWGPSHKIGSKESIRDYCSLTKQGI